MAKKQHVRPKRSNSYDPALREVIAWRIAEARKNAYPHTGGLTKCAAEFGISPQQWSQYEGGHRSPEDQNLERIAAHLKTTVRELMTQPENWHMLRDEWVAVRSAKGRKKAKKTARAQTIVEQTRAILGIASGQSHPLNMPPAANTQPHIPIDSSHGNHSSRTLELIQKIITVDKLRSEGKISMESLASTLKSVDVLIDALYREVGN
jgi:transcriptional regulator with XRE-family HTH domain